jgi:hypothetical protein
MEEMKNATIWHEEVLTSTLVKHKEEMESITKCLKIEEKFFKVQIKKRLGMPSL